MENLIYIDLDVVVIKGFEKIKLVPISEYLILDDSLFAEKGIGLDKRREVWRLEK